MHIGDFRGVLNDSLEEPGLPPAEMARALEAALWLPIWLNAINFPVVPQTVIERLGELFETAPLGACIDQIQQEIVGTFFSRLCEGETTLLPPDLTNMVVPDDVPGWAANRVLCWYAEALAQNLTLHLDHGTSHATAFWNWVQAAQGHHTQQNRSAFELLGNTSLLYATIRCTDHPDTLHRRFIGYLKGILDPKRFDREIVEPMKALLPDDPRADSFSADIRQELYQLHIAWLQAIWPDFQPAA